MKSFCILLLSFTFLTIDQSWAIDHQQEIAQAQQWVNSVNTDYPILIFDRDRINFLYAQNQALGEDNEKKRLPILRQYILEQKNIELDDNDLSNIDTYLSTLPQVAVALPATKGFAGYGAPAQYKFCSVFPIPPNGNAQTESERMLGLDHGNGYSGETYEQVTKKLKFEELYLFSLYHEIGHCLDPHFMPEAQAKHDDSHAMHLSEAFAETFAYLSLSQRLDIKVADARALYRTVYSRMVGQYLANNPNLGFGDPHLAKGGVIYHLGPYLIEAYEKIRFKEITPDPSQPQQLLELAYQIVSDEQLAPRSFTAIARALAEGFDPIIAYYGDQAFDSPEFFYESYIQLQQYENFTDLWLQKAFDSSAPASTINATAAPIPTYPLCQSIQENDPQAFYETLKSYRGYINQSELAPDSVRERYNQLNNLNEVLLESCG